MERVLVTGATGFIGVELIRQLNAAGLRPRALVRRPHRAALLSSFDTELFQGDLHKPESLVRALDGVDTVFHLGGRASFETYRRLRPTIVDGTAALAEAAASAGAEHFMFASSLFVYGDQPGPIHRSTAAEPVLDYGKAKLEAERALAEVSASSQMRVGVLRLPHVYGPQSILFKQIRSGIAIFPGRMKNRCGHLHVGDAARSLHRAADSRWEGTAAIADTDSVTWTEYFDVLSELYPYFRLVALPQQLALAGATVIEPVLSRRVRPTLYTRDTVKGFNLEVPVDAGWVWDELAIAPRYASIFEGIPAALDGYVHYRWRHPMLDHRWS